MKTDTWSQKEGPFSVCPVLQFAVSDSLVLPCTLQHPRPRDDFNLNFEVLCAAWASRQVSLQGWILEPHRWAALWDLLRQKEITVSESVQACMTVNYHELNSRAADSGRQSWSSLGLLWWNLLDSQFQQLGKELKNTHINEKIMQNRNFVSTVAGFSHLNDNKDYL